MENSELGVAISKRIGERRLLTKGEYFALDRASSARWEFWGLRADPVTGDPDATELGAYGFSPGGPTVIPGDSVEVSPGIFQYLDADAADPPKHWFER